MIAKNGALEVLERICVGEQTKQQLADRCWPVRAHQPTVTPK
jgi:hypothetical protein